MLWCWCCHHAAIYHRSRTARCTQIAVPMSPPFLTFYKEILNSNASAWTWLLTMVAVMERAHVFVLLGYLFMQGCRKRGSAWPLWSGVSRPLYPGRIQPLKLRSAKSEICGDFFGRHRWCGDSIIIRKKDWHWLIDFTTHLQIYIFNILILIGTFNCYSWVP